MKVTKEDITYELDLNERIDSHIYNTAHYEPRVTRIIEEYTKPGMVAFDIGANMGYYTLRFAKVVGKEGKIVAFEPMSYVFRRLQRNIELNSFGNIKLEKLALSDINEIKEFHFTSSWPLRGGLTHEASKTELIDFVTLDEYVRKNKINRIDFIKLDVDGYEYKVLSGGVDSIKRFAPFMIVELGKYTLKRFGDCIEDLIDLLGLFDYSFFSELNLTPYPDRESLLNSVPEHSKTINVFCVPNS